MGLTSSIIDKKSLHEFQKLESSETQARPDLPVSKDNRNLTDKKGFVIVAILLLILIPFLIYTLAKSDIRRYSHGFDNCGNLCGIKNEKIDGISCSGKDYSDTPFETVNIVSGEKSCSKECPPGYTQDDNTCYGDDNETTSEEVDIENLWTNNLKLWWKYLTVILITTVLCIFVLILIRFIPKIIIWSILIISLLAAIIITVVFWIIYQKSNETDELRPLFLFIAIITTIFTIVITVIFLILRKRISLIVLLYEESAKAFIAMPTLIIFPVITLLLQVLVLTLMVVTTTYMASSAILTQEESNGYYVYKRTGVMNFTLGFNAVVTLWAIIFFSGCQYMILAGSTAQWYFKKDNLQSPITNSFVNTLKYHLGTVAIGSFIIVLVAVIKAIIKSFISNEKIKWIFDCCCGNIEALLKFFSRNAFIETAIYGQSFFRSGKRAASLLISNVVDVVAINSVGDFVLSMIQFIILAISTGIAYAIFMNNSNAWLSTIFSFIINFVIIMTMFGVLKTIINTLFICFCEDKELNDGSASKPYYMTVGFQKFIEESTKSYNKNKAN